jgi:serine/threonine-protein phosphatase CPPED1
MKRLWLAGIALLGVGAAVVLSGVGGGGSGKTFFPKEERNPVTHLRYNDDPTDFQFAIVSDRTGGHRAQVFSQAVENLNLLQPAFVLSVGDLIEGGKKTDEKLAAEWKEFDGFVNKLTMPFFYVAGNHDVAAAEAAKFWESKLGRRYYHFVYRNVLFLILNADDPPGSNGGIGKEQLAFAQKALKDNAGVRWTIVAVHRPLWTASGGAKNGWGKVEKALKGRSYTVFVGHEHQYKKFVRQEMNYYQLATTGGGSMMRGVEYNEFDHLVWVTMKKDGPLLTNILLDSVLPENLQKVKTDEPGVATAKRLATHPAGGFVYFEGTPIPGAVVTFTKAKGASATGVVEADGSFKLSTYQAFDGAPAGAYQVTITAGKSAVKGLPAKYATAAKSELRATIQAGKNEIVLELKK